MSHFLVVSGADSESDSVYESLRGRAISPRMGIIPWSGTAEQLHQHLRRTIPRLVLIASLSEECLLFGVE
jgi:hypothetical protein